MHKTSIFRVDKDGRELLVAVSFGLAASEAVADRRSSFQIKRWEAYARLYKKVDFFFSSLFLYCDPSCLVLSDEALSVKEIWSF